MECAALSGVWAGGLDMFDMYYILSLTMDISMDGIWDLPLTDGIIQVYWIWNVKFLGKESGP